MKQKAYRIDMIILYFPTVLIKLLFVHYQKKCILQDNLYFLLDFMKPHQNLDIQPSSSIKFQKGITLEEYMKHAQQLNDDNDSEEEDLYVLCNKQATPKKTNKPLITFAINEIDEDNYDQDNHRSLKQNTILQSQAPFNEHQEHKDQHRVQHSLRLNENPIVLKEHRRATRLHSIEDKTLRQKLAHSKAFQMANHSNSPIRNQEKSPNTKNDMFRSLYGNSKGNFSFGNSSQASIFSSTNGANFFKGLTEKTNTRKQTEFQQKNRKHYNEILKYERVVRNKFSSKFDALNIRIDGVKDRLCERKNQGKK